MEIILSEGKRDEALGMFLPLFQKRGIETNISKLKQLLLNKFVTEAGIHALSQGSNFYLLGVAMYYFNGELTKNSRLNALYPQFKDKFISLLKKEHFNILETTKELLLLINQNNTSFLSTDEIKEAFAPSQNTDEKAMKENIIRLIELNKEREETDNISAILIRVI